MAKGRPSTKNQQKPAGQTPGTTTVTRSPNPKASEECHNNRETKERDWYDWVTLGVAVLALLGLWYYAYWAKVQAISSTDAASAAISGAKAAEAAVNYQITKERARITIDDLTVVNFPGAPHIRFTLDNLGQTAADDIGVSLTSGAVGAEGDVHKVPQRPATGGPSLGGGKGKPYDLEVVNPQLLKGKMPFFDVRVGYRDLRGSEREAERCVWYTPYVKDLIPCFGKQGDIVNQFMILPNAGPKTHK
jgi:hypothetical protein